MRLVITLLLSVVLLSVAVQAEFDPNIDYMREMMTASVSGNIEMGKKLEQYRNEKIDTLELEIRKISFEDLFLLSKIIYAEAGSNWLSENWKMSVGEVVLNRVESPEFPNTIPDVIYQPNQYYGKTSRYFNNLLPSKQATELAVRLLKGERYLEPQVVYQANFPQGGGVYLKLSDKTLGNTYFCISSNLELY